MLPIEVLPIYFLDSCMFTGHSQFNNLLERKRLRLLTAKHHYNVPGD